MKIHDKNSVLGRFLMQELHYILRSAVKVYATSYRNKLRFGNVDKFMELTDIYFKYAENVTAIHGYMNDIVLFDAIIEGDFSVYRECIGERISELQLFRVKCAATIEDGETYYDILKVGLYYIEDVSEFYRPNTDVIPYIPKEDYEHEAELILKNEFPIALMKPMPVPIKGIAEGRGLEIIETKELSKDLTILGQICFADGYAKIYDKNRKVYKNIKAERGTVFIDSRISSLPDVGCKNDIIAHEFVHWFKHRSYATMKSMLSDNKIISCRCPASLDANNLKNSLSENDYWMESQANSLAHRILMPKEMADIKIRELMRKHNYRLQDANCMEVLKTIICELSDFFKVSKQTAQKRMFEIGYEEVKRLKLSPASEFHFVNKFFSNGRVETLNHPIDAIC